MRGTDAFKYADFSATQGPFTVYGGRYAFAASGTWNSGSLALQMLGPDGSTYIDIVSAYDVSAAEQNEPINTLKSNGMLQIDLCPGTYQLTVGGSPSALYASVVRIPIEA